ncbi:MAG TPA: biotin/lipoyl-binding protein, partial [Blastocatellia bacterium]|nr:biotin/lipoyl-binding protein [Blastocatellia bacterium]
MKKIIATLIVLAVAGGAGWYFWGNREAAAEEYMTAKIERGDIRNSVFATGTLQAVTTVQVGSQVSGTISALHADFNTRVRKGQVVAQLDPSILQAQVASARANLEQARANLADAQARLIAAKATVQNQKAGVSGADANVSALKAQLDDAASLLKRQESLAKGGIIPERDLETARTNYKAAEARYKQASAQLEQARASEQSSSTAGI